MYQNRATFIGFLGKQAGVRTSKPQGGGAMRLLKLDPGGALKATAGTGVDAALERMGQ